MLDIAPTELLLVALVALIVIGPKDLPRVMRVVGQWVGRARGVARHFRSGFDEMVRQAELDEMEKKWRAENERIMREHPIVPAAENPDGAEWKPVPRTPYPPVEPDEEEGERGAVDPHGGAAMTPLPPRDDAPDAAPAKP
ncbi:Sec-independent protein translocase protein TatB [Sphingomonas profundi]|uniref:Sec-independent protein translocase protein TatB n=1 Tax=Alterirhizorhabdus profundi TaxID=2681549 RepID=UPI0012E97B2D|nr:Sec-independent protein translocase protein TatB [Sphingomonas profundi]